MPARIDTAPLRKLGKEFAKLAADSPKEMKRAVGSTRRAAATETQKAIRQRYNVKVAGVKSAVDVRSGNLSVTITADNSPISATQFAGTRQVKKGLRLQVLKGGKAAVIRRGFVAKTKKVPFIREGQARLPIRKATGPSAADMLDNTAVRDPLADNLIRRAVTELDRRLLKLRGL